MEGEKKKKKKNRCPKRTRLGCCRTSPASCASGRRDLGGVSVGSKYLPHLSPTVPLKTCSLLPLS